MSQRSEAPVLDRPSAAASMLTEQLPGVESGASFLPASPTVAAINLAGPGNELLSNFAATPFSLDGIKFASAESFYQYIKLPPDEPSKEQLCAMSGTEAQEAGKRINASIAAKIEGGEKVFVYWGEKQFEYRSAEHFNLIRRGLEAKLLQNEGAARQLLDTGDRDIQYIPAEPEKKHTSLPRQVFCNILTELREQLVLGSVNIAPGVPGTKQLSNFTRTPFTVDGIEFACGEAFFQYMKYPDGHPGKEDIRVLTGRAAQQAGTEANEATSRALDTGQSAFVYWRGAEIPFGSREHLDLIQRGLAEKFKQNAEAREELLATGDKVLRREYDFPERKHTSLPRAEFVRMMTEIREELKTRPDMFNRDSVQVLMRNNFMGAEAWAKQGFEVQEEPLPKKITRELLESSDPLEPSKKVRENYMLIYVPPELHGAALSINAFHETANAVCEAAGRNPAIISGRWRRNEEFANAAPEKGEWHLVRKSIVPDSRFVTVNDQSSLLPKDSGLEIAEARAAAVAIAMHYLDSDVRLYEWHGRTRDMTSDHFRVTVGGVFEDGAIIGHDHDDSACEAGLVAEWNLREEV